MKFKLLCCEVFFREACIAMAASPHTIDPEFMPKGAHENPNALRSLIQSKIDEVKADEGYDAILLGFGLCGNSTVGISARSVPLVVPRAHDCCTLFLGSKQKFMDNFKDNLSAEWTSPGYMERGQSYLRETDTGKMMGLDKSYNEYIEQYGEENARFIWETLHPNRYDDTLIYIDIPETAHLGFLDKFKEIAEKEGKKVHVIPGDMRLIRMLLNGDWSENEYLVVSAEQRVKALYDHEQIIAVE